MSYGSCRKINLLEHTMRIFERVLEKRLKDIVNLDEFTIWIYVKKAVAALFVLKK